MFTICLERPILGGYILQYPLVVEGSPNVEVVVVPEEVVPLVHVHPRDLVGYDLIQEIFLWPCNINPAVSCMVVFINKIYLGHCKDTQHWHGACLEVLGYNY